MKKFYCPFCGADNYIDLEEILKTHLAVCGIIPCWFCHMEFENYCIYENKNHST